MNMIKKIFAIALAVLIVIDFASTTIEAKSITIEKFLDFCQNKEMSTEKSLEFVEYFKSNKEKFVEDEEDINFEKVYEKFNQSDSFVERASNLKLSRKELTALVGAMLVSGASGQALGGAFGTGYSLAVLSPSLVRMAAFWISAPAFIVNSVAPLPLAVLVTAPVGEELVFRGVLQNGVLTRLPKLMLKMFGVKEKKANRIVTHRATAVARVVLVSWLFAISHIPTAFDGIDPNSLSKNNPRSIYVRGMIKGGAYPQFFVGLFLGAAKEITGSLYPCMALHALYNGSIVTAWPLMQKLVG